EDFITIDRKHLNPWAGKLSTRILILTNETPKLEDPSGALASRFIVLKMQRSFFGKEDDALTQKLLEELPQIFYWALAGLDRLNKRRHFIQPEAGQEALD